MLRPEIVESKSMCSFKTYDKYLIRLLLILLRLSFLLCKKGIKNSNLKELSGLHEVRYKTL